MSDAPNDQHIRAALERVEHPAIATTLLNLGIIRDIEITAEGQVTLSLVLPFANIPDNIRDFMINSLAVAAQSAGGELVEVNLAVMNELERQEFLSKEEQHWRG